MAIITRSSVNAGVLIASEPISVTFQKSYKKRIAESQSSLREISSWENQGSDTEKQALIHIDRAIRNFTRHATIDALVSTLLVWNSIFYLNIYISGYSKYPHSGFPNVLSVYLSGLRKVHNA